jgi:putative FmdB family regulatory protein
MPMYEWKCLECEKESTIIRKFTEYNVPPEQCPECGNKDVDKWKKFISSPPQASKSLTWRMKPGGKGNP